MMKKLVYLLLLLPFLFSSCKSKKALINVGPHPVLKTDSLQTDTSHITSLFTLDHDQLKKLKRTEKRNKQTRPVVTRSVTETVPGGVAPGTVITSSQTSLSTHKQGIERVMNYDFTHRDVPEAFDGFRIAFVSDFHYKSWLTGKRLKRLVSYLKSQKADVLLMGGDYQEGCQYVPELFDELAEVRTPMGTYGVMGNNDYEQCHEDIIREMQRHGMHVLEHRVDTLRRNGQQIILAGVRNPFDLEKNATSPTLALSPSDFVILLVHTPDYVEDVAVTNTDLALAGHTHGGQVRVLGYAPIIPSHYGDRFLTGLLYNTAKVPMIVTNGIGTSNMDIRIGAPAEVVIITLHRLK